eukprot:TRINITY_DN5027_c0_g1_i1.p1 TRINITY_DN5027_c0_g1~~TRINITY_DN5027_c0_g1_i1.p1  ORF type:complete len:198 (-),score=37.61 TRINITY_DN5027_c0_g1_i1:107-655(-)
MCIRDRYKSVLSKPQYKDVNKTGYDVPGSIAFNYPLNDDSVPPGLNKFDSWYSIEPYTGLVFEYHKKTMMSLIQYYDELYPFKFRSGIAQFVPFYSTYEKASVSNQFLIEIGQRFFGSKYTREQISVTCIVLGIALVCAAVGMIVRSCWFTKEEIVGGKVEDSKKILQSEVKRSEGLDNLLP